MPRPTRKGEMMDYSDYYSDFPAPYNEEVPRRIAELSENLSPIGVEVLVKQLEKGKSSD
jgi:hypothetical protein